MNQRPGWSEESEEVLAERLVKLVNDRLLRGDGEVGAGKSGGGSLIRRWTEPESLVRAIVLSI